jgi:hypothetical protein
MHDRQKGIWFPAKKYGWGWGFPVVWQGWLFFVLWAAALFGGIAYILANVLPSYVIPLFLIIMGAVLIAVCLAKGEQPKWRWGTKS